MTTVRLSAEAAALLDESIKALRASGREVVQSGPWYRVDDGIARTSGQVVAYAFELGLIVGPGAFQ